MKPIKNLQQFRNNRIIGNGQIYVSTAGVDPLDNPEMVFLDYEGTIAVPTPIKTNYNGQPVIDGVAYNTLYVNYDYSLQIVDADNVELFNPFISEQVAVDSGIPDAPANGQQYGRKDNAWDVIDVQEAPEDGKNYVRKDGEWQEFENPGASIKTVQFESPTGRGENFDPQNTGYTALSIGAGIFTITHNLGHTNYIAEGFPTYGADVLGVGDGEAANKNVTTHNLQENTLQVFTTSGGNGAPDIRVPFGITIYDFGP